MAYIYICKALYIHICPAYMHVWRYIPLHTASTAYIYVYICGARPQITTCKPLMLQEVEVSIEL